MKARDLPVDRNWHPINVLKYGATSALTVGTPSASVALPTGVTAQTVIRVSCNTDCYIELGTSGVTATTSSPLFLAGVEYITVAPNQTHIAALQVSSGGVLTVTEVY